MIKTIKQPLLCACGLGVNTLAYFILLKRQGRRPDAILFANVGNEKDETYECLPIWNPWLTSIGFPEIIVVRYVPKDFKHYPPYHSLGTNCLTNGTLPSLAFGFKSCSLKWKVAPQDKWAKTWQPAIDAWAAGLKVRKIIGYDTSANDQRRYAHAQGVEDPLYEYEYPLVDAGWDRERCIAEIRAEGLPVPPKSACIFCPATKEAELREFKKKYLREIVMMEARAFPRLDGWKTQEQLDTEYNATLAAVQKRQAGIDVEYDRKMARCLDLTSRGKKAKLPKRKMVKLPKKKKEGDGCRGLWRKERKRDNRPALMTEYIRREGLLPSEEIDQIWNEMPEALMTRQESHEAGDAIPNWDDFIEMFNPEDEYHGVPLCHIPCSSDLVGTDAEVA